jgi:hypothetical protein
VWRKFNEMKSKAPSQWVMRSRESGEGAVGSSLDDVWQEREERSLMFSETRPRIATLNQLFIRTRDNMKRLFTELTFFSTSYISNKE